ncbi:MAG: hypothetical protein IJP29_05335 [Lachnospiraceae bacterium]|nr:hypothetical protein [Lachnospiraceae bacterium]
MDENNITSTDYTIGGSSDTPAEENGTVASTSETVAETTESSTAATTTEAVTKTAASEPIATETVATEEKPAYTLDENTYSAPTYTTPVDYTETYSSSAVYGEPVSTTKATISLVCGILSIVLSCCCCGNILFSIAGIICGCMQQPTENGKKPGTATAGIITSIIGIVITVISFIAGFAIGFTDAMESYY